VCFLNCSQIFDITCDTELVRQPVCEKCQLPVRKVRTCDEFLVHMYTVCLDIALTVVSHMRWQEIVYFMIVKCTVTV